MSSQMEIFREMGIYSSVRDIGLAIHQREVLLGKVVFYFQPDGKIEGHCHTHPPKYRNILAKINESGEFVDCDTKRTFNTIQALAQDRGLTIVKCQFAKARPLFAGVRANILNGDRFFTNEYVGGELYNETGVVGYFIRAVRGNYLPQDINISMFNVVSFDVDGDWYPVNELHMVTFREKTEFKKSLDIWKTLYSDKLFPYDPAFQMHFNSHTWCQSDEFDLNTLQ